MNVLRNPPHLNYYRLLERDLDNCFRFVDPSPDHHNVYSDEFARIILMAASEIENALKAFSIAAGSEGVRGNIKDYFPVVTSKFPRFTDTELYLARQDLVVQPWRTWTAGAGPEWWTKGYNKIKHDRINNPGAATLIRAIEAVAALQALLLHLYRLRGRHVMIADRAIPTVIVLYERSDSIPGASMLWQWTLPDDEDAWDAS